MTDTITGEIFLSIQNFITGIGPTNRHLHTFDNFDKFEGVYSLIKLGGTGPQNPELVLLDKLVQ